MSSVERSSIERVADTQDTALTRRSVLAGAAGVGVTAALAACSGSSPSSGSSVGAVTVNTGDVPVGGGKILPNDRVVVTQPTAGTYKAFGAACTHQGCIVARVQNGVITCTCHGSQFSAADGSVITGPATRALPARGVDVSGDTITVS